MNRPQIILSRGSTTVAAWRDELARLSASLPTMRSDAIAGAASRMRQLSLLLREKEAAT